MLQGLASACAGFVEPQLVTARCTPSEGIVHITFVMFQNIYAANHGAAVYVSSSPRLVTLQSDAFFNCTAGVEGTMNRFGGCAYLGSVQSGSGALDCCATRCEARAGSFWHFDSQNVDAAVKGLAAFDCKSADGALDDYYARVRVSGCNFTKLNGSWGIYAEAAAIYQGSSGSSTKANFSLFESCVRAYGVMYEDSGNAATFAECSFVSCGPAIAHYAAATGQDVFERCFFASTTLISSYFNGGSALIRDCLFAGVVPEMPESVTAEGTQQGNTATQIEFDTPSMLETCGGPPFATLNESPTMSPSPKESPDFESCSGTGGCLLGDADFRLFNLSFEDVIGAIVWRADKATLAIEFVRFTKCRSVSGIGGACDLAGGIQVLIGICATNCEAKIGGFALIQQPAPKSVISNCGVNSCRATVRGGAFALQKTYDRLTIDNLNLTGCSSPVGSAITMGHQHSINFIGFMTWDGGFAIGFKGTATSCIFFNSTSAPIRGDVFSAVGCRFRDVGNFEGFVTVNKCEFAGADAIDGLDAGGNVFGVIINPAEGERCPTPTPKITPLMLSPYARRREILQFGIFASAILLLA